MYQVHWGLKESPFPGWIDPDYFYASSVYQEALARLQFLAKHRRRLGLLVGEHGCGKSMLFQVLARELKQQGCQVAITNLLGVDQGEFLAEEAGSYHRFLYFPGGQYWRLPDAAGRPAVVPGVPERSEFLLDHQTHADPHAFCCGNSPAAVLCSGQLLL